MNLNQRYDMLSVCMQWVNGTPHLYWSILLLAYF